MISLRFRLGFWGCLPNIRRWLVGFVLHGGLISQLTSAHFPHLYSDFRIDFSSGSSRFLSALSSAPPPAPVSFFRPPAPRLSAPSCLPSLSSSSGSAIPPSLRFPAPPVAPVSSPFPSHPVSSLPQASSVPSSSLSFPFGASRLSSEALGLPQVASLPGVPGSSVVSLASAVPVRSSAPPPVPSLRCLPLLFLSLPLLLCLLLVIPSLPLLLSLALLPLLRILRLLSPSIFRRFLLRSSGGFSFSLPEDSPPEAFPRVFDPVSPTLTESARSEFRCMMSFIVDLFPQAAGSPSVPPPPRALFKDFFSSFVPPPPLIFLNWFERVRSALADADSRLASFVASGRGDYLFLPSRSSTYAVHGDFVFSGVAPVNPSLLSLFERRLKPTHHVGLTIRETAALEASLQLQSEALSHSMWVLSALLGFVRLQNFAPEDLSLFNTLVTSLSKSLAHQASLTATHTAFVGLKRREFYLSPSGLFLQRQQAGNVVVFSFLGLRCPMLA